MPQKKRVLILCTGNSCRSQMAEGLINHFLGEEWQAFSAGIHPSHLNPYAVQAMAEIGIDISTQKSESVASYTGEHFDWVITLCAAAQESCPAFPGAEDQVHIGFRDPADAAGSDAEILRVYQDVRDGIQARVLSFLAQCDA